MNDIALFRCVVLIATFATVAALLGNVLVGVAVALTIVLIANMSFP